MVSHIGDQSHHQLSSNDISAEEMVCVTVDFEHWNHFLHTSSLCDKHYYRAEEFTALNRGPRGASVSST
jgi:hypothetical protein